MKKLLITALALLALTGKGYAEEGMWLLPYLKTLNFNDMKAKGLKLSAEDIYSVNNSSLKDAVVQFGGGCTGEIISSQGLLMTNYHCGYGAIQQHSTVEYNYLKNGFWAMNKKEEIPTPGLKVTFVDRIEDVSDQILPNLNDKMTQPERAAKVKELSTKIVAKLGKLPQGSSATVREFLGGNQYILFVNKNYSDVRMVGAPPFSIGKYGADTDNWMWPRHKADFALFRVYADKDGNPVEYSPENIPLTPKKYFNVSMKGVQEGDYAMIIGFPGSTNRFMSSWEIDETVEQQNPALIYVRGERQNILMADMKADPKINIQYAGKYSGSSNYWKNAIGKSRGLQRLKVKQEKEGIEAQFTAWVNADPARKAKYGEALKLKEDAVKGRMPYTYVTQYIREALLRSMEILSVANRNLAMEKTLQEKGSLDKYKAGLEGFYKDYNESTDHKVSKRMLEIFCEKVPADSRPTIFSEMTAQFGTDYAKAVNYLYQNSIFANQATMNAFLANPSYDKFVNDPAVVAVKSINQTNKTLTTEADKYYDMFDRGHRLFIAGLLEMNKDKVVYYPDANSTMRLTYGNVGGYKPADAVTYNYYTTLTGVLEKEDPNNLYEFEVPDKLKALYKAKDFGAYAYKGDIPVCFITNNDITGGNSGSPVLNANGELIGAAFDGNWEAMSGDIAFEPNLQRTIVADMRYILFVIDKYAGAKHLIDEMTIVQ